MHIVGEMNEVGAKCFAAFSGCGAFGNAIGISPASHREGGQGEQSLLLRWQIQIASSPCSCNWRPIDLTAGSSSEGRRISCSFSR
jgi:hypothetical protein